MVLFKREARTGRGIPKLQRGLYFLDIGLITARRIRQAFQISGDIANPILLVFSRYRQHRMW